MLSYLIPNFKEFFFSGMVSSFPHGRVEWKGRLGADATEDLRPALDLDEKGGWNF